MRRAEVMSADSPRRRSDIESAALPDGSLILFDAVTTTAYPLTATAAVVWLACDGTRSVAEIVGRISAQYDATEERIERDVEALLQRLDELGLLHPCGRSW